MQQAGTRQGAHRRAPARHLPAGRLALCRSLHTAITRFLGRFSWSCGYKAQAAIEQKLEPTLFGSTLDKRAGNLPNVTGAGLSQNLPDTVGESTSKF
jgi:hypothetical protein